MLPGSLRDQKSGPSCFCAVSLILYTAGYGAGVRSGQLTVKRVGEDVIRHESTEDVIRQVRNKIRASNGSNRQLLSKYELHLNEYIDSNSNTVV